MAHSTFALRCGSTALRATLVAAVVTASLLLARPMPSDALEKVTFGYPTPTVNLGSHAALVMAMGMGFFAEEGLDVEPVGFKGSGTLIPQLANRRVLIGFANPDILILSRQPGRDHLPLKFFYNAVRRSIWTMIVLENSPIKELTDLRGKKLGVGLLTYGNVPITKAMLKELGMEVGKDVDMIAVGLYASAFQALISGQIAALNGYDVQDATLETTGTRIRRLPVKEKYLALSSNGLLAHEDTIKNQGKTLAAFGRAYTKGIVACDANPAGCVRTFWRLYPTEKPTQGTEERRIADGVAVVRARLDRMAAFPPGAPKTFGEFSAQGWKDFVETLHGGGQLTTTNIPIETLYTNQFVEDFNRFDVEATLRAARALK